MAKVEPAPLQGLNPAILGLLRRAGLAAPEEAPHATPLGPELEIRGDAKERTAKKTIVAVTIFAAGVMTVRAEVIAVPLPKTMESAVRG